MPFLAPIITFIVSAGLIARVGITIGLAFLSRALAPKPPKPGASGRSVSVRDSDAFWQIVYGQRTVGGVLRFIEAAGANNQFLYLVYVWCYGGPDGIQAIDSIYFGEELAINGTTPISKYSGLITVENFLGTDAQAASTTLTTDLPAKWTSNDKLSGHAYTVLKLKWDVDKFGDFNTDTVRAKISGRKVLNRRTGAIAYSTNLVDCISDFVTNTRFGLGTSAAALDVNFNNAQANVCDEQVAIKAGGTEARYSINAAFTVNSDPLQVLAEMAKPMAGSVIRIGAKVRIYAGTWRPPMLSISDDDIIGNIRVTRQGRRTVANAVKGTCIETTNWQPTNYPTYQPTTYYDEDGVRIYADLEQPFVTSLSQAQRLAKIHLERLRRHTRLEFKLKLRAWQLVPGDTFALTHRDWVGKTFLAERVSLAIESGDKRKTIVTVNVVAREEDAGVFLWNASADENTATTPSTNTFPAAPLHPLAYENGDPTIRPYLSAQRYHASAFRALATTARSGGTSAGSFTTVSSFPLMLPPSCVLYKGNLSASVSGGTPAVKSSNSGTASNVAGAGTDWSNPSQALGDDALYAVAALPGGGSSDDLRIDFDFSASPIPTGATLKGFRLSIKRFVIGAGQGQDSKVQLHKSGTANGTNKSTGTIWPSTEGTIVFGANNDLWGTSGITVADLNNGIVGCLLAAVNANPTNSESCEINNVTFEVFYDDFIAEARIKIGAQVSGLVTVNGPSTSAGPTEVTVNNPGSGAVTVEVQGRFAQGGGTVTPSFDQIQYTDQNESQVG